MAIYHTITQTNNNIIYGVDIFHLWHSSEDDGPGRQLMQKIFTHQYSSRKHRRNSEKAVFMRPWRLAMAQPLVEEMLARHAQCNIPHLLRRHCAQIRKGHSTPASDTLAFSQPVHQVNGANHDPIYAYRIANYLQVIRFVLAVMNSIVPDGWWGSDENRRAIEQGKCCIHELAVSL